MYLFSLEQTTPIRLDELAVPFYQHMVEHVKSGKRQTTSRSSQYLYACSLFAEGKISEDELISLTVREGFKYVLDAFPKISGNQKVGDGINFYSKAVAGNVKGIEISDSLYNLRNTSQASNLAHEVEGRWNLVEASWDSQNPNLILEYDDIDKLFCTREQSNSSYLNSHLRTPVTKARKPLSGYQKGKCFYCFDDISIESNQPNTAQVDHFFPISLQHKLPSNIGLNLNGVWNLVLACKCCNGDNSSSKWAHTPSFSLLPSLMRRNGYYINSNHPLGKTILSEIGATSSKRSSYITEVHRLSKQVSPYEWTPKLIKGTPF